jgi:hypothetical protein
MTRVMIDANTLSKFAGLHGSVEVCNEAGQLVGFFRPAIPAAVLQKMAEESHFSEHELQRIWSQDRVGQPLSEILPDLAQS